MARRQFTTHPLVLRRVEVRRIREITPRMRRITVGGPALQAFSLDGVDHPPFRAPGFDDHLKLIFAEGDIEPALPMQLAHGIEWTASETRRARDYTPRRVGSDEIDLDFVRHGHGVASLWAEQVSNGDELWFVGPKSSTVLPDDLSWIMLAGDETALPAIGRFLDERPTSAPATVVVTVSSADAVQELALGAGDSIDWVVAQADDRHALQTAVRGLDLGSREAATGYAWGAAESRALLPLRRYLSKDVGLAKDRLNITGYWHHEEPHEQGSSDEHAPRSDRATTADARGSDADGSAGGAAPSSYPSAEAGPAPAIPSPRAWLVVRAALRSGLLDAVAEHPRSSLTELANRIGIAAGPVGSLLHDLRTHDVIAGDDEQLHIGPRGDELLGDEHAREEFDGPDAAALLSLATLDEALRTGRPAWQLHNGATFAEQAAHDSELQAELQETGEQLAYLADGLMADPIWNTTNRCVLIGPGAVSVAHALAERHPGIDLTIADQPTALAAVRQALGNSQTLALDDLTHSRGTDLVVLAQALGHRTDAEARVLLQLAATIAPAALVIEPTRADTLGGPAIQAELVHLAVTGVPRRDLEAITALAAPAGWHTRAVHPLGWGVDTILLTTGLLTTGLLTTD